jgi:hypothetical protein
VTWTCVTSENKGFSFHTSFKEAKKRRDKECKESQSEEIADNKYNIEDCEIDTIEIEPTKKGILKALNDWFSYPHNG